MIGASNKQEYVTDNIRIHLIQSEQYISYNIRKSFLRIVKSCRRVSAGYLCVCLIILASQHG